MFYKGTEGEYEGEAGEEGVGCVDGDVEIIDPTPSHEIRVDCIYLLSFVFPSK